ncbi:2'-5' RNA ligase family protein [Fulvimonas yonginensis]|uniref:2'-5' RNA ligase family protein n=1 Tax=Fulvimonas yonginensis TaxID=1495200 RepID=A0ABU8JEM7_9GAMM
MPSDYHQASLAGFAARQPTDRLFFALMPPSDAAAPITTFAEALRRRLGLRGKPRPTGHLHVTLHHLGDFAGLPAQQVAAAATAAAGVATAPFEVRFDRAGSLAGRAGRHPFVLLGDADTAGPAGLQAALGARLAAAGLLRRERPFVPHLTLLYDARMVAPQPIEPIGWEAREFVLIHSLLGRTEYRVLGRWALAWRAGAARTPPRRSPR